MAELVDARDLKSLESNLVPVRLRPWALYCMMKKLYLVIICILLSGCARGIVPIPETLMPERYTDNVSKSDYGKYPNNYQKILKDYLMQNLLNQSDAQVEFVNQPSPLSVKQMGNVYHGYRVCLSINSRNNKNIYTGFKTHLFILKDNNVDLHLFDSGLLKIPFELCVERDESKTLFLDQIPDENIETTPPITIDNMDEVQIPSTRDKKESTLNANVYILCKVDNLERTFVFNQGKNTFVESIGINEVNLTEIQFSTTHILGYQGTDEILINRVSGSLFITNKDGSVSEGKCELLDKTKF